MPERRRSLLVFLSGAGLLLLQFSAARSLSSLLLGTELILFLVVFSYFAGLSTGFALSGFLDERRLRLFLWAQWLTQLTLPFSLRWLTGLLAEDSGNAFLLVLILFLGAFWASSLYSIILPRLLASRGDEDASGFARRYGLEALGGACGLAAAFFAARLHPALPMILQQAVLALVFALLLGGRGPALLFAAGAAAYAAAFAPLERASAAFAFSRTRGVPVRVLYTADSPYQRVEVFEREGGARELYLDGIRHYGGEALSEFNQLIAGVPAALLRPAEALIVGTGSFETAHHALASSARVTSVELDPAAAEAGRRFLARPFAPEELSRWTLVFDDGKHFLARCGRRFGLVVLDLAGPLQRQVALLYSREFFELARSSLAHGGALSLCLNGDFPGGAETASRIAATLLVSFEQVFIIAQPGGPSFAVAGSSLPFGKADILRALKASGHAGALVLDRAEAEALLRGRDARPISLRDMGVVLRSSMKWLRRLYL
ncbi:MAG TPA: hypothetical protein DCM05_07035 [Elusimicrobia bacterium]|nr:hypothetical protein [Elusimicrobiota bacterium]